jgi:hypothetical protein
MTKKQDKDTDLSPDKLPSERHARGTEPHGSPPGVPLSDTMYGPDPERKTMSGRPAPTPPDRIPFGKDPEPPPYTAPLSPRTPDSDLRAMIDGHRVPKGTSVETLLVEIEAKCMAGGSVGLDDVRAVLKALREG